MQRTVWKLVAAGTLVALTAVVAHARPAQATPGRGATVVRIADACVTSGDPIGYQGDIVMDVQDVETPSGNSNFRCAGKVPAGFAPKHAVSFKADCFGPAGAGVGTIVFSASGNVSFECHIRN